MTTRSTTATADQTDQSGWAWKPGAVIEVQDPNDWRWIPKEIWFVEDDHDLWDDWRWIE